MALLSRMSTCETGLSEALGLAVEKAMKISPELLEAVLPVRARPMVARRAMRFSW